jgi:hypothetical protein
MASASGKGPVSIISNRCLFFDTWLAARPNSNVTEHSSFASLTGPFSNQYTIQSLLNFDTSYAVAHGDRGADQERWLPNSKKGVCAMNRQVVTKTVLQVSVGVLLTFAAVWHFSSIAPLPRHVIAFVAILLDATTYMVYLADGDWTTQGARKAYVCFKANRMAVVISVVAIAELCRMAIAFTQDQVPLVFTFSIWTLLALVAGLFLCLVTMVVVTFFKPNTRYLTR